MPASRASHGTFVPLADARCVCGREVERLRTQNQKLERQLRQASFNYIEPSSTALQSSPLSGDDILEYSGSKGRHWGSAHVVTDEKTQQTRVEGPSSLAFFLRRLSTFLNVCLCPLHLDLSSYANSTATIEPSAGWTVDSLNLQRQQQDYFLDLFWLAYHCIYPVIEEAELRELYVSLWLDRTSGTARRPSPLVDIVMALCIRFGTSFIQQDEGESSGVASDGANSPDRVYFHQCYKHLITAVHSPSLTTLQCCIFSIIYLRNASLMDAAQTVLAMAIRMAYTLGLNQEPPAHLPYAQKELRRRIWWTLYMFDSQFYISQGQPWLINPSFSLCQLPDDSPEVAQSLGPRFPSPSPNITSLSFQKQAIKLLNTTREIHGASSENYFKTIGKIDALDFYRDGEAREQCALFLAECMKKLRSWVHQVPEEYKTNRKSRGHSFSTDRSALDLDQTAPTWLQRQRLLLELRYHSLAMSLYRPFICFTPTPSSSTPLSDNSAISCLSHAITITNIMHQVVTETDVLNGCYESFQCQQDAMFTLVGFACAYPICPPTPSARKTILAAIDVLDLYGNGLAAARRSAQLARVLNDHAELIINRFRASLAGKQPPAHVGSNKPNNYAVSGRVLTPETGLAQSSTPAQTPGTSSTFDVTSIDMDFFKSLTAEDDTEYLGWMNNDLMSMDSSGLWPYP